MGDQDSDEILSVHTNLQKQKNTRREKKKKLPKQDFL